MKVLELCLSPDLGGLEIYMQRCCRAFLQNGDEVVAVVAPGSRLVERLQGDGISAQLLSWRNKALPLLAARQLARTIDEEQVDFIHMHWGKDMALAVLAKVFSRRKPKLVSTRQMQITRTKQDPYHRFLYRQVDLNITITRALAEEMGRFLPVECRERITPLYYGVAAPALFFDNEQRAALRAEMGLSNETFLIGLIGRVKHYKGQHLLVEAVERLLAEGADVAALIVGHAMEPEYLANLKQRVAEKGLEKQIQFRDFTDQPQRLMQTCDTVVLTTVEETFGLVLVEAMRAGVAVVGSNRGGVPEIIEHGISGLLFESGSSDSLYQQLRRYYDEPELRAEVAQAGKAFADEQFDEAHHFPALRKLFSQLAGDSGYVDG